jgi:Spermine/spermidine synthase domain
MTELFTASLLSLYFELIVIRWLSSEIRIFAYFKNIPLMACLFGLGLGMALAGKTPRLSRWFPLGLTIIVTIISLASPLHLVHVAFLNPLEHYLPGEFLSGQTGRDTTWARLSLFFPGLIVLVAVFYLIVFTFMGIGQRIGELLRSFRPLVGYTVNILGSLIGIALFTIVSFLSLPPPIWLLLGLVLAATYFREPDQLAVMFISMALAFGLSDSSVLWSPYYRIGVQESVLPPDAGRPPFHYGYNISVNYDAMEGAYNNGVGALAGLSAKQRRATADYYDTPYVALGDKPRSVLVLAAGTGNDVAAALRHGATEVDAVEIDPTIVQLGRELHPEKPYDHPSVHVIVDDARAFLKRTDKRYDLIVFAYLDSHSAFSAMSSLRLDNYVYTKESFQDARGLLKSDGVISVTFYYLTWWQLARVQRSLEEGSGEAPIGVFSPLDNGPTLLVGPGLKRLVVATSGLRMFSVDWAASKWHFNKDEWDQVRVTTDDWPFLFLRRPSVGWTYGIGLFFTLLLGWRLVAKSFGKFTADPIGRTMFLLGAAFMLIETKSVTQMGLIAGTTWIVNSAVVSGVLLMILAANALSIRFQFRRVMPFYALLFVALALNFVVPLSLLNGLPTVPRLVLGASVLSAPLFLASIIFAALFSAAPDPSKALGINLLGALVGGVLEYSSMMVGINALNVLASALYGLSIVWYRKMPEQNSMPRVTKIG